MKQIKTQLSQLRPELPISLIQIPEGHSLNDVWANYGTDGILQLLQQPNDKKINPTLEILSNYKISYEGTTGKFYVIGNLPMDLGNLRVSLHVLEYSTAKKHRLKIDLFDFMNVKNQCRELSEKEGFDYDQLQEDMILFTNLLEEYRESLFEAELSPNVEQFSAKELTPQAHEKAVEFLSKKNLLDNIDKLLEQSGIIGEQENRKLLFILASSYKMPYLLHGLVQGSSGEGKSHLINVIADCMPQEDIMNLTRITNKSLYHYQSKELVNKLIIIQDFEGLDKEAQFAFREMQSAKFLTSSTVVKDIFGNNRGKIKRVEAHFASLTCTTKTEVYYDNMSRCVVLGIDESLEQTLQIIKAQNLKIAGLGSSQYEFQAKQTLRNCMRVLKSYEVVNPFADKLTLPLEVKMLRRLNNQFQNFVSQITILHQYQRKIDHAGRLIVTKEDVQKAVEIFFNSIIIKVDELDKSTRQFFEILKDFIKNKPSGTTYKFNTREIRQELNYSKTAVFKYFKILLNMEYIQAVEGSTNKGFKYLVSYWDNMEKLKAKIKTDLNKQLEQL
jgi:predicted transcriptional regulator